MNRAFGERAKDPNLGERRRADWQLPVGVDRALWEYTQDESIAWDYDDYFSEHHLLQMDRDFLTRHFGTPGRLVDLGCGTGRILVHFAQRGFEVVGVDLSQQMLAVSAAKQSTLRVPLSLVRANLCELSAIRDHFFDYATCMFSTLGMIVGVKARRRALLEFHRILRPGGLLGFHLHNRWFNMTDSQGRRWLLADLFRQCRGGKDAGDKVMANYRGIPNVRIHLFSLREIRRELAVAGFRLVEALPLAPSRDGVLRHSWCMGGWRANGWLLMART
ncbi:MAG: class I SAM-dependent methyltransferase [Planctomycetota bacterium]